MALSSPHTHAYALELPLGKAMTRFLQLQCNISETKAKEPNIYRFPRKISRKLGHVNKLTINIQTDTVIIPPIMSNSYLHVINLLISGVSDNVICLSAWFLNNKCLTLPFIFIRKYLSCSFLDRFRAICRQNTQRCFCGDHRHGPPPGMMPPT